MTIIIMRFETAEKESSGGMKYMLANGLGWERSKSVL